MTALTVTGARLIDGAAPPVTLRAVDGVVAEVGPHVEPRPGDTVVDAAGMALVPGLVNGHTHAAMTLFRGYGDDLPLMEWLHTRIWPAEARLDADAVYWGTRLACLEMVRSGTTTFWDMYWHSEAVAQAVVDSGLRAAVSAVLLDRGDAARMRDQALASIEALAGFGPRVTPVFGPHAIYTVSEGSLAWLAEVSAERGIPVQIHLAETAGEVDDCVAAHGVRPVPYLDRLGLLHPDVVLAHCCWCDADELALIAARGATVVTNPASNLKLAVGRIFPYAAAAAAGVAIGLGTDGAASNNSLDLLQDVKLLALLQKHEADDPAALPAAEALAVAAGQRAPRLGATHLRLGDPADFLLVRTDVPELAGPGDITANLVYAATGAVVDTTVVAGQVLMRGRDVPGAAEVLAEAAHHAERIVASG